MTEAPAPAEGTPLLDGAEAPASAPVDNKERERLAVEKAQETGPDGLSSETYAARFEEYGPNVLEEVKKNECLVFLSYFWGPMPIMIWVATLIVTLSILAGVLPGQSVGRLSQAEARGQPMDYHEAPRNSVPTDALQMTKVQRIAAGASRDRRQASHCRDEESETRRKS